MCNRMSADERAFLCVIGAVQNTHNQHAEALIRYLILPVDQKSAYTNLDSLAKALAESGFFLVLTMVCGLRNVY